MDESVAYEKWCAMEHPKDQMAKYYMTFAAIHPLHDCWIEVWATSEVSARMKISEWQGKMYGDMYGAEHFHPKQYPGGCVAEVDMPNYAEDLRQSPVRRAVERESNGEDTA